jgi:hypothetical protein
MPETMTKIATCYDPTTPDPSRRIDISRDNTESTENQHGRFVTFEPSASIRTPTGQDATRRTQRHADEAAAIAYAATLGYTDVVPGVELRAHMAWNNNFSAWLLKFEPGEDPFQVKRYDEERDATLAELTAAVEATIAPGLDEKVTIAVYRDDRHEGTITLRHGAGGADWTRHG